MTRTISKILSVALALALCGCDGLRRTATVALPAAQAALEPIDISMDTGGVGIVQLDSRTIAIQGALDARLSLRFHGAPVWTVCKGAGCRAGDASAGRDLYYRVATGEVSEGRWAQLQAITCEQARATLPALVCPARQLGPVGQQNPSSGVLYIPPPPPPTKR